jgi:hypothetical protein
LIFSAKPVKIFPGEVGEIAPEYEAAFQEYISPTMWFLYCEGSALPAHEEVL